MSSWKSVAICSRTDNNYCVHGATCSFDVLLFSANRVRSTVMASHLALLTYWYSSSLARLDCNWGWLQKPILQQYKPQRSCLLTYFHILLSGWANGATLPLGKLQASDCQEIMPGVREAKDSNVGGICLYVYTIQACAYYYMDAAGDRVWLACPMANCGTMIGARLCVDWVVKASN